MKSLKQIAKECNLPYMKIYSTMHINKIVPTYTSRFLALDEYQEDLLHFCLYRLGELEEITLESKINETK